MNRPWKRPTGDSRDQAGGNAETVKAMISNLKSHRPEGYFESELQALDKIANSLFRVLSTAQKSFVHKTLRLSKLQLRELSAVMVEFAEDILNKTGIWKSLERYNQSFFGTPLPFSLAAGQKMPDAPINKSRIHYLLWNKYSELCDGLILSPGHTDLSFLVEEIVQFFDDQIITGFPDNSSIKALMIRPNQYGWDIKKKLLC